MEVVSQKMARHSGHLLHRDSIAPDQRIQLQLASPPSKLVSDLGELNLYYLRLSASGVRKDGAT